jgi:CsoR family transcriptional regulator, copper-sensing transcriptional repressor
MHHTREKKMENRVERDEVTKEMLFKRLRRIEGQVRGIEKMITEDRDCESLITQLAAVRSAIESVGAIVLKNYMKFCYKKEPESEAENIDSLARAISVWGHIRIGD